MRLLLVSLLAAICIRSEAQQFQTIPLAIADPRMDNFWQKHPSGTLTIKINHLPDSEKAVKIKCTYVQFGADFQVPRFYKLDSNGFLQITLDHQFPFQQIWLEIEHYLYAGIYVNDGLNISIDAKKISDTDGVYMNGNGVEYAGKDGEFNRVMNQHVLHKKDSRDKLNAEMSEVFNLYTRKIMDEHLFLQKMDSIYRAVKMIDDEFIAIHSNYEWAIRNEWDNNYYQWLCFAYGGNKLPDSLFNKIDVLSPYCTSNDGVQFYKSLFWYIINKNDNPKIQIDDLLYRNYGNYNAEQKVVLDSMKYYNQLSIADQQLKQAVIKDFNKKMNNLFFDEIQRILTEKYIALIDSLYTPPKSDILKTFLLEGSRVCFARAYPEILNSMHTGWCKWVVKNELTEATLRQKNIDSILAQKTNLNDPDAYIGRPLESLPFHASLYRLDSAKNIDALISNLKSRFPGKALVIDFWATWCAPCLAELPISKQFHETNKDLPVEYIYICTNANSSIKTWKNKVAELQIPGTHIFANEEMVAALKRKFNVEGAGYPTYISIDVNGKLKPQAIQWMQLLDRDRLKQALGL